MALLKVLQRTAETIAGTDERAWTLELVNSRLGLLEGYWQTFAHNHVRLLTANIPESAAYVAGSSYGEAEDYYVRAQGAFFDAERRLLPRQDVHARTPGAEAVGVPLTRLPRLEIPSFSGKPEDWEAFRDIFTDLVHNNGQLGDAAKISFLKMSVKGVAEAALRPYRLVAVDYTPAWEALISRYDHPALQVKDHLEALEQLTPLETAHANGLQDLLDRLRQYRHQLMLEKPVDGWDDWFVHLARRAMDPDTRLIWADECQRRTSSSNALGSLEEGSASEGTSSTA